MNLIVNIFHNLHYLVIKLLLYIKTKVNVIVVKAKKIKTCFRDSADYLFWNLKDFLYSEFFFGNRKKVKEIRGVFKKQWGLKEDCTFVCLSWHFCNNYHTV